MVIPLAAATASGSLGPLAQVAVSAAIFILLWQIVGSLFFKPFLEMLIERENRTIGDEQAADAALQGTEETEQSINAALGDARKESLKRREAELAKAKAEANDIVTKAQKKADEELATARAEIDRMIEESRREMAPEVEVLSDLLVKKAVSARSQVN